MVMGMERYISMASHISDEMKQEEKLCGKANIDDAFDSLVHLAGPEVAARLNEYRTVGEFNRELRQLPEDIRYLFAEIILNDIIPMAKSKAPIEKIREAALKAVTEAGLLGDTATNEPEDGTE